MTSAEISQGLISEIEIRNNLQTIFPDSIILKNHFKITSISSSIISLLGYDASELLDHTIDKLAGEESLVQILETALSKGFFDDRSICLKGKENIVNCKISGFYLGLISDINDTVILKIKGFDEADILSSQLETSRNELDEFIYRTTHDLRGPLATMRGLINLMKLEHESTTDSMKYLIGLLETHAQTLDNRLFNLNYLSETGHPKTSDNTLDCEMLESILRSTIEENTSINCVDFKFTASARYVNVFNSQLTTSMLNHLLLYLINLPKSSDTKLTYSIEHEGAGMRVTILSEGFLSNYQLRQAVSRKDPLFTTIVMYSDLINFFAAMKNAQRMGATIQIDSIYEMSQQISVMIPSGN